MRRLLEGLGRLAFDGVTEVPTLVMATYHPVRRVRLRPTFEEPHIVEETTVVAAHFHMDVDTLSPGEGGGLDEDRFRRIPILTPRQRI